MCEYNVQRNNKLSGSTEVYNDVKGIKIIATIGTEYLNMDPQLLLEKLQKNRIQYIRINLAKYETKCSIDDLKNKILILNKLSQDTLKIMLDLPIPYKKIRFYLGNKASYVDVKKGEKLKIAYTDKREDEKTLYLSKSGGKLFEYLNVGNIVTYGDGECEFIVLNKQRHYIEVANKNDVRIFAKKSLNFENIRLESRDDIANHKYTELIQMVKPWAIAFSFISSKQDILDMKQYLSDINVSAEIIGKIETMEGVQNILEIMECSDVMLARGDLNINVPVEMFYDIQKNILEKNYMLENKIYVATGILGALAHSITPTQAEITDLSFLLKYNPEGIVLNYGVVRSAGIEKALEIIRRVAYYYKVGVVNSLEGEKKGEEL